MAMFLPEYDYRGLAASHYQIVGEVMNRKHAEDQKVIERLEMQQRLSKAYVECRKESGADLKSYHTLQTWTSMVRLERIRYHPELTGDLRHRTGPGAHADVGMTRDGLVVDLLSEEWRKY